MAFDPIHDEYEPDDETYCPDCGCEMGWEDCPDCGGDGMIDCYEDDAINYASGQEYEPCSTCEGRGGWDVCPNGAAHDKSDQEVQG